MLIRQGKLDSNDYMKHALSAAKRSAEFSSSFNSIREVLEHPVCNKCEKVALRTHGWRDTKNYVCPNCGDKGRATAVLRGYLKEKGYR